MTESFYSILGVDEKATKEDIKKAYRSLSLKHHPDKNNSSPESNILFKKIGEAYETLGDDEKRRRYDMTSNPFFKMSSESHMDSHIDEIFQTFFGMNGMPGISGMHGIPGMPGMPGANIHMFTNSRFSEAMQKPTPIIKTLEITMTDVLNGTTVPLDVERWLLEKDTKIIEKETLYINIPKGIDENEIIILKEKGNVINERCCGDVKIFIKVINNSCFERKGLDLIMLKSISLKEALCGFTFEFEYINGKTFTLNNNGGNIIPPNYKKVINAMGLTREGRTGNLIIHFYVEFPEKLSEEQMKKISEIL